MLDGDIRLAAKLARAAGLVHPMDWVKVYESHNEYEWRMQIALMQVEPWGEDRADYRAAMNTAMMVEAQAETHDEGRASGVIHQMRTYLPFYHKDD